MPILKYAICVNMFIIIALKLTSKHLKFSVLISNLVSINRYILREP